MMLPADSKSVMITRPSVIIETFIQETLRSLNIAETVVESSGAANIRSAGDSKKRRDAYMKDSLSSGPNSSSLYRRPSSNTCTASWKRSVSQKAYPKFARGSEILYGL